MIAHERLKEVLYYHPESGDFVWLMDVSRKIKTGKQAGSLDGAGYRQIGIDGIKYRGHVLAFFYVTGEWPSEDLDHEDTVKHHNWWTNLRPATTAQNGYNAKLSSANTSGLKHISWSKRSGKWRVAMQVNEKHRDFGLYAELNDAIDVCAQAMLTFHGPFARTS